MFFRYYRMLRRLFIIVALAITCVGESVAQYDASFSHFFAMEPSFNPGAVGKQSYLNVAAAYALDMAGYEHNPRSMYVGADMPVRFLQQNHGIGAQLLNDQLGLFTHRRLSLQYAFKHKLWGGMLSVGLQADFLSEQFKGSEVDAEESNDPALPQSDVTGSAVDMAFGAYYMRGPWYAACSVQHLTAPLVSLGDTYQLQIDRTYYFTGGYNIRFRNPFLMMKTAVLLRTDGVDSRADVNLRCVYSHERRMLYGGATYSPEHSVTLLAGGLFHGVRIGYSYEIYTSGVNPGNGSHGLFVGYQHAIHFGKKGKNIHKSVRFL